MQQESIIKRADALRAHILEFSANLAHTSGVGVAAHTLVALRAQLDSLGGAIDEALESNLLLKLPTELQVRILSGCDCRTLCQLEATAHAVRRLVENAEPAAALAQYGGAASLRPAKRSALQRLRWLEQTAEYARQWVAYTWHENHDDLPRTVLPDYNGIPHENEAESRGFMLAVVQMKLGPPPLPTPRTPFERAHDGAPESPPVLEASHPQVDVVYVACMRTVLALIDPELAPDGVVVPSRRAEAVAWLERELARADLPAANRAYAVAEAQALLRPKQAHYPPNTGGALGLPMRFEYPLPAGATQLLRGLWRASRHSLGVSHLHTARRALTYVGAARGAARWFSFFQGARKEEERAECEQALREAVQAQASDPASWPPPHRFLTTCALCEVLLCGAAPLEATQLFEREYWSIRQSELWLDAQSDAGPVEPRAARRLASPPVRTEGDPQQNDYHVAYSGPFEAAPASRLQNAVDDVLTQIFIVGRRCQHEGQLTLAEALWRWLLQLSRRESGYADAVKNAPDGSGGEERSSSPLCSWGLTVAGCMLHLAEVLVARDECTPKLQEAVRLWEEAAAVLRSRLIRKRDEITRKRAERRVELGDEGDDMEESRESESETRRLIELCAVLCPLAALLQRLGEDEAAAPLLQELIGHYHALSTDDSFAFYRCYADAFRPHRREHEATMMRTMGERVGVDALHAGSEALQRARIEAQSVAHSATHDKTLYSRCQLGAMLLAHEKASEACDELQRAVADFGTLGVAWSVTTDYKTRRQTPRRDRMAYKATNLLKEALSSAGRSGELDALNAAWDAELLALPSETEGGNLAYRARVAAYVRTGNFDEAEAFMRRTLAAVRHEVAAEAPNEEDGKEPLGVKTVKVRHACRILSELLMRQEDALDEAEEHARTALQLAHDVMAKEISPWVDGYDEAITLAMVLNRKGRGDDARLLLRKTLERPHKRCGGSPHDAHAVRANLALLLMEQAAVLKMELEFDAADEEDARHETALRLKWSDRAGKLEQAAQLLQLLLAEGTDRGDAVSAFSSSPHQVVISFSQGSCSALLAKVHAEQRLDKEYWEGRSDDADEEPQAGGERAGGGDGDEGVDMDDDAGHACGQGGEAEEGPTKLQRSAD